jgi:hypothetical protein
MMRLLAGAIILLAGAVLAGASILAEVMFVTSSQRGGAGSLPLIVLAQWGGLALGVIGLILLVSGFLREEQENRKADGT